MSNSLNVKIKAASPAGGTNDDCSFFTFGISSLSLSKSLVSSSSGTGAKNSLSHNFLENFNVSSASLITSWGSGFGQNLSPLPRRRNSYGITLPLCSAAFFHFAFLHSFLLHILTNLRFLGSFVDRLLAGRLQCGALWFPHFTATA